MRPLGWVLLFIGCVPSSRLGGTFDCTPDASVTVGCSDTVGRRCSGRPIMALCDGTSPDECLPTTAAPPLLGVARSPPCPNLTVTCPSSGSIDVAISQGGSGAYTCTWEHVP